MTPTAENDNQKLIDNTTKGSIKTTQKSAKLYPYQGATRRFIMRAKNKIDNMTTARCVGNENPANPAYITAHRRDKTAAACCALQNKPSRKNVDHPLLAKKKTRPVIRPICKPAMATK